MEKNGTVTTVFFAMEQSRQPERTYDVVAGAIERLGRGELRAVVDRVFPLADAAEAHRYVETGQALRPRRHGPLTPSPFASPTVR